MPAPRVTIADVASHLGVSPTAVSLVVNGRPNKLSAATVQRIHEAVATLGYRPNLAARALSTKRTQAIGFVSDEAATRRDANELIRGALHAARQFRHILFIAETEGDEAAERESVEALVDRQVDGIIYAVARSREVDVPSAAARTRLVMLNATSDAESMSVLPDEREGGRTAASLLVDSRSSPRIAIVGYDPGTASAQTLTVTRRLEGIWSVLDERGVAPIACVECAPWDVKNGYLATKGLLEKRVGFDALICLNDRLAFGSYRALAEQGLRIPEDVSVISFDNDPIAQYLAPELTTIALPYDAMGQLAVQLLMDPDSEHREYLVPMPVFHRGSLTSPGSRT